MVWPEMLIQPGEASIGVSGNQRPVSSAEATAKGFITEPGSNTSVMARLRRPSLSKSELFGLYEGWLTMASTSPVLTSSSTTLPERAPCLSTVRLSSR